MNAKYHFLPWLKQGIAQFNAEEDNLNADISGIAEFLVYLKVNQTKSKNVKVRIHGPGDVTGISRTAIIRMEPKPWTETFEPNYFPVIDFDLPEFPWLFTPAKADKQGRLRPWICLIVVRKQEGVTISSAADRPCPVLTIAAPAKPENELPDLAESWAWAHVQLVQSKDESFEKILNDKPAQNLSRLICPRKLEPKQSYYALLVPTFEAGRKTGLGIVLNAEDEKKLHPAWLSGAKAPTEITLPIYHHWEFSTGENGDFLSLIQLLNYVPAPDQVGTRKMVVQNLPFGLPDLGLLELEGALRSAKARLKIQNDDTGLLFTTDVDLSTALKEAGVNALIHAAFSDNLIELSENCGLFVELPEVQWRLEDYITSTCYYIVKSQNQFNIYDLPPAFPEQLRTLLNLPAVLAAVEDDFPIVAPPIYGSLQMASTTVPEQGILPPWLRQLNLDPRARVAAGLGTLVVQDQQEELMTSAWAQLAQVHLKQTMQQLQLGREVSQNLFHKLQSSTGTEEEKTNALFQLTAPVFSKIRMNTLQTATIFNGAEPGNSEEESSFKNRLKQTALPQAVLSPNFRRFTLPGGVLARRFQTIALNKSSLLSIADMVQAGNFSNPVVDDQELAPLDQLKDMIPPGNSTVLRKYREAALPLFSYLNEVVQRSQPKKTPFTLKQDGLAGFRNQLLEKIQPELTFAKKAEQIKQAASKVVSDGVLAPAMPQSDDPLTPELFGPNFPFPMYEPLQDISQDFLLPGIEYIQNNTVTALETNPEFVEAFMAGLNHEMSRELLWRDYPVNQKATFFRQFWNCLDPQNATDQFDPIHEWDKSLGLNFNLGPQGEQLVLLIKGELLRRFPSTIIYAVKAKTAQELSSTEVYPLLQGRMEPDIHFFGFPLTEEEAISDPGWFFIIQQQPTEPRFGFENPKQVGVNENPVPSTSLSWGDLVANPNQLDSMQYVPLSGQLQGKKIGQATWGYNAANMAMLTMRKPLRVAIPAKMILKPKSGS